MQKSIGQLLLCLALLFSLSGYADCESDFQGVLSEPYFWRISKDGVVSHALGTIHSGVSFNEMPDFVKNAINTHKVFLFEGGLLNARPSLPLVSRLSEDEISRVRRFLRFRFPHFPDTVEGLFPSLSPSSVYLFMNMTESQFVETVSHHMDQEVLVALGQRRVKIQSLDTDDNLERALRALDEKRLNQVRDLITGLKGRRASRRQVFNRLSDFDLDGFVKAYRTSTLEDVLFQQEPEGDELENSLIRDRRQDWISAIESAHDHGGALTTGGVAHFIHPRNGILRALHHQGYSIHRLVLPPQIDFICEPSNQAFVLSYSKVTDLISVTYRNRQVESFPVDKAVKAIEWETGEKSLIYKFGNQQTLTIKSELESGSETSGLLDLGNHSFHIQLTCQRVN